MSAPVTVWTEDRVAQLKALWAEGLSGLLIGQAMDLTRSAVWGKVHRLKLPSRVPAIIVRTVPDAPSTAPKAHWQALEGHEPVTLMELEPGLCKWPIGTDRPYLFCGAPAKGSYCDQHHTMSYRRIE